jgi:hypothetical protein
MFKRGSPAGAGEVKALGQSESRRSRQSARDPARSERAGPAFQRRIRAVSGQAGIVGGGRGAQNLLVPAAATNCYQYGGTIR